MSFIYQFPKTTNPSSSQVFGLGIGAYDITNKRLKIGDGTTPFSNLPYVQFATTNPSSSLVIMNRSLEGVIYANTFMPHIVESPGSINNCRIALVSYPVGLDIHVDIRKNGTALTNSIFTNQLPLKIRAGVSTTNTVLASNVATLTVSNHSYIIGDSIQVSGCTNSVYNGTFTITATSTTTISYAVTNADITTAADTGGLITQTPVNGLYMSKIGDTNQTTIAASSVVAGDVIWICVTQVGSTLAGADLIAQVVIGNIASDTTIDGGSA